MSRIFYVAVLLFIGFNAMSQKNQSNYLTDIELLFKNIERIHPDMYFEIGKEQFLSDFSQLHNTISQKPEIDIYDLYMHCAKLVAKLGDGHTNLLFPYHTLKKTNEKLFPYTVNVNTVDSSVTILHNRGDIDSILIGATVTAINTIPIRVLVDSMLQVTSGEKVFFKLSELPNSFTALLYAIFRTNTYSVDYMYDNILANKIITAIPYEMRYQKQQNTVLGKTVENYSFKLNETGNIGVIDFRSFDNLSKFKTFLDSVFTLMQYQNVNNLIIDIRNNGGGDSSLGDELFQYISPVPFTQYGSTRIKSSKLIRSIMRAQGASILNVFLHRMLIGNGTRDFKTKTLTKLRQNPLRYSGKTFLLTSNYTFSSAADFAWAFKHFNMGTVIGEETGGLAVCYGDILWFSLPHSKLRCCVSFKKFYNYGATDKNCHGTIPDIALSAAEAMDYVLKMLEKK